MADLYARAGVQEYWVVDIPSRTLHLFREPSASGYQQHERLRQGEARPLAFSRVVLPVSKLFPS
jgi:Uma2 family endonuclease